MHVFTIVRQILGGFVLLRICVLRDPTFPAEKVKKKKKKRSSKARQGRIKHVRKISESLKNGVDIWTFVRLSAEIAPSRRNYLYLVHI